jgi:hypothetical protein
MKFIADSLQRSELCQESTGFADFREDETAGVFLPEGVWILAQDKRSAVLGMHRYRPHSPVGTA